VTESPSAGAIPNNKDKLLMELIGLNAQMAKDPSYAPFGAKP
jgi:hypothetical protein